MIKLLALLVLIYLTLNCQANSFLDRQPEIIQNDANQTSNDLNNVIGKCYLEYYQSGEFLGVVKLGEDWYSYFLTNGTFINTQWLYGFQGNQSIISINTVGPQWSQAVLVDGQWTNLQMTAQQGLGELFHLYYYRNPAIQCP